MSIKRILPVRGSIVYRDIGFGLAEHSGICIGIDEIVHLNGFGLIEIVSFRDFISISGFAHKFIYTSCYKSKAIGSEIIAENAEDMIGRRRSYNFIMDNCHQFTSGCITGDFDNTDNFLWMLKYTANENINIDKWEITNFPNLPSSSDILCIAGINTRDIAGIPGIPGISMWATK